MANKFVFCFIILIVLFNCKENSKPIHTDSNSLISTKSKLDPKQFEKNIDGKKTKLFYLKNKNGLEATITNFGLRIVSLHVPDSNGNFKDIVLGFSSINDYLKPQAKYFGSIIGRYGNRIAKGSVLINQEEFRLTTNSGEHHLHGGHKGFNNVIWNVGKVSSNDIEFYRTSKDLEEGYPGNLKVSVNFKLTDNNELTVNYFATTDKTTIINLTHHPFFNLSGEGNTSINKHLLMINADYYTPINKSSIPTGEIAKVKETPFNFVSLKPIGKDINTKNQQLLYGKGYDHNFVLNDKSKDKYGINLVAKVVEPNSGRVMEVYTNEPGIQFYTGNFLNGETIGKSGKPYVSRSAFCLETQHFPDSPNHPNFPSTLLEPGETYKSTCIYKFKVEKN
ncbi:aldose epimerase family protein [Flavivirga abyssicola]|uniref:aldose epimerase family protein n=1 Tax=Flavivirga abyssicola TaxID=3063533 RepID=UPI0026E03A41|nr:aldose epimerase family protein [Flavivirga sp. MEBiC07777]WVK12643.1 aldose epimerase family protein [Flavivirga sp. MEBiC07777]